MQGASQQVAMGFLRALGFSISMAQESPTLVTVANLSINPPRFDGHLVRLRAWVSYGWEGENFFYDPTGLAGRNKNPESARSALWFYCDSEHYQLCGTIRPPDQTGVLGWFTGYFHFVPKTRIVNGVFDPGHLQFEVIGASRASIPRLQTQ